ncbi:class I SAM-dependent methyltransferase [Chryseobacterium rhizosphaerae]|uniref:Class I SAM-dependent methyltransferase n=1 Tax=Chryseobacterium rhizosphaerae TaxID=395937 RepID=A0ABX9IJ72_9FLAO|nr:class I SAM-dependent methyltransferase [Chryseobacterium rhizosphaerae]REC74744.1 hypothetical protein DRF57_13425 [Chryseobacterium rhizosphaerae]GEN66209.1 hypothetical protein CRH01_07770 [Chryseobacterium rhizosphaerae]
MNAHIKTNVPLTSALVLQQSNSVYTSDLEKRYLEYIDFGSIAAANQQMTSVSATISDVICLRKRYIRKALSELLLSHPQQQVCILGAGLDPLSIFLLEHCADRISHIFEVDGSDTIHTKATIYSDLISDTDLPHCIQCNLTDTKLLMETLQLQGYQPEKPSVIIFEGVVHYIHNHQFITLMQRFRSGDKHNRVIMDYCLELTDVPEYAQPLHNTIIDMFEKFIDDRVNLYSRKGIMAVINDLNVSSIQMDSVKNVEFQLNGNNKLFHQQGEGLLEMLTFSI